MTLKEALVDVEISSLHVEFAIRLLSCCEREVIDAAEFRTTHVVLLETGRLEFPAGNFTNTSDIVRAASVNVSAAIGTSALTLDKAWEVAGIQPSPDSEDETVKLRTLAYMIGCAYAHGIADPRWRVKGSYRRLFQINLRSGLLELDLPILNCQRFDFNVLGGHTKWFEILDMSVTALTIIGTADTPE